MGWLYVLSWGNRASIFSRFPFGQSFALSDTYTAVCREILTPRGPLVVYATIIGITGGKDQRFRQDFEMQKADIKRLVALHNVCVMGDFNISFAGYAYPSKAVINEATTFFDENNLEIITKNLKGTAEHIAVSRNFIRRATLSQPELLSCEKEISDHGLVSVEMD